MRISDWSSDVCSSDLFVPAFRSLLVVFGAQSSQGGHIDMSHFSTRLEASQVGLPNLDAAELIKQGPVQEITGLSAVQVDGQIIDGKRIAFIRIERQGDRKSTRLNSSH